MVKLGLIPNREGHEGEQEVTLTFNDSGKFEDRWVYLKVNPGFSLRFHKGHERGRTFLFVTERGSSYPRTERFRVISWRRDWSRSSTRIKRLKGRSWTIRPTPTVPIDSVAGICDGTGRLLGMMPHPEAYHHRTNHPRWTREEFPDEGAGIAFFRNAVEYIRNHLL